MRNFDFKSYTPRPKKLLRASLKKHGFEDITVSDFQLFSASLNPSASVSVNQKDPLGGWVARNVRSFASWVVVPNFQPEYTSAPRWGTSGEEGTGRSLGASTSAGEKDGGSPMLRTEWNQGTDFATFWVSGINIFGQKMGSVMEKYTSLRPCDFYRWRMSLVY